jgi:hypothetical protein
LTTSTSTRLTPFHIWKTRRCQCSFRLLMMGSVSETCWASYKYGIIKVWYTVASCWILCMNWRWATSFPSCNIYHSHNPVLHDQLYMLRKFQSPWFNHPNNIYWVQKINEANPIYAVLSRFLLLPSEILFSAPSSQWPFKSILRLMWEKKLYAHTKELGTTWYYLR